MSNGISRTILSCLGADEIRFRGKREVLRHRNFASAAAAASFAALVPLELAPRSSLYAISATLLILAAYLFVRSAAIMERAVAIAEETNRTVDPALYQESFRGRFALATCLGCLAGVLLYCNLWPAEPWQVAPFMPSLSVLSYDPFLVIGPLLFAVVLVDIASMSRLKRRLSRVPHPTRASRNPVIPARDQSQV